MNVFSVRPALPKFSGQSPYRNDRLTRILSQFPDDELRALKDTVTQGQRDGAAAAMRYPSVMWQNRPLRRGTVPPEMRVLHSAVDRVMNQRRKPTAG